ncbi:MAG: hypothetical protein GX620_16690 [Chloroflexi bacterium]|nr:hypothetical protein [Chloroflexota bacterium]
MESSDWSDHRVHPPLHRERWLYYLRHAGCQEARLRLWEHLRETLERMTARVGRRTSTSTTGSSCSLTPALDYARQQNPGQVYVIADTTDMERWDTCDYLIFAPGVDLVAALFDQRARLARSDAPTILFSDDQPRHPVEALWLLERIGYTVYALREGPLRQHYPAWRAAAATGQSCTWLLALHGRRPHRESPHREAT